ncbi:hypothetical protein SLW70_13615 [Flavobacterium sp. NG2]|uniref:hypothetical protein n=1 Tax=Flavobacterium sp. NG2 TaxID=3097547 RepID=UPI002A80717B|nr:hypothetical protein [Flavobacterium sp. NG2]WPR70960.1 hypothetical protein SLW70_13615 [Flavobacterium sp. NG2]
MKNLITLLCLLLSLVTFSQKIEKEKGRFFIEGKQISSREARELIASNTEALALFNTAKNKEALGGFFMGLGSALVVLDVVIGAFSDVQYPTAATYGGLACLAVSIPVIVGKRKKMNHAIELYNEGLQNSGINHSELELNVVGNQLGYGLQLRF